MGGEVRYEFPWPPRELSPNVSVYWRTLGKAKAQYKDDCGWAAKAHIAQHSSLAGIMGGSRFSLNPPVTAQVTFLVPDNRRRDSDNHMAMLKPMWDALVEMGVLEDDSHDKLRILEPKWERGPKLIIVELSPYRNGGRE